ncbi:MAG: ABC transporter ATP-binding protein [Alphaproteobacteria bacterium]|nr:ABC transporter ATP-binding protein [Alphaproteobacteria bacterium]
MSDLHAPFLPPEPAKGLTAPVLELIDVTRAYAQGEGMLEIFKGLDLTVERGEIVGLVGQSGAGKSTLLHIAGLLDTPTSGEVRICGRMASGLPDADRTEIRLGELGFVYQFHHLLPEFSALENVSMPRRIAGEPRQAAEAEARRLLDLMGLAARATHRPGQLSGGEQQRVAIARALANRPKLLLADEPTGNLDTRSSAWVFDALVGLVRGEGVGALIATHNLDLAKRMDRVVLLHEGRLAEAARRPAAAQAQSSG